MVLRLQEFVGALSMTPDKSVHFVRWLLRGSLVAPWWLDGMLLGKYLVSISSVQICPNFFRFAIMSRHQISLAPRLKSGVLRHSLSRLPQTTEGKAATAMA